VWRHDANETFHHPRSLGPELLSSGLKKSHQDGDQQDVVPQAGFHGWFTGDADLLLQDLLQR